MKLFKRISALALTLVVIAMLAISASAASFSRSVPGDFGVGVGAMFNGNLTTSEAWSSAVFYGADDSSIDLIHQRIVIEGHSVNPNSSENTRTVRDNKIVYGNDTVGAYAIASDSYNIQYATYTYDAYYIANGVIDCYMNDGPVTLTN